MRRIFAALILLVLSRSGAPAAADELLVVSAGAFDVGGLEAETTEAGLELRLSPVWGGRLPEGWRLRPIVGAGATSDNAQWRYAGFGVEVGAGRRWLLIPSFAVALFDDGNGKDLGSALEFRSGIEAAYRLGEGYYLGLLFYHLSNAGTSDTNPGSNSLLLTFSTIVGRP